MTELKPCPFCGAKAMLVYCTHGIGANWAVECTGTHAHRIEFSGTQDEVIREWNRGVRENRFEHMTLRLVDAPRSFGIVNRHGLTVATFEVDETDPQYDALMKAVNDGTKVTINITRDVKIKMEEDG